MTAKTFVPHPYQEYCIQRLLNDKAVGLLLDMGLGKTVITLTAINEMRYNRFLIDKTLVIAPKKVAEATWTDERDNWEHLKHLRINLVLGTQKQRVRALNTPGDIWVINRENVKWLVEHYQNAWPFDCVVIDELSSFKNHAAKRFKALKAIRPKIERIIGLTGTPAPNGYMDLWAPLYLLDQGERLEKNITAYRARYFDHNPWRYSYTLKDGAKDIIDDKIRDICISMSADDYLTLPDMLVNDIPVKLTPSAQKAYDTLETEAVLEMLNRVEEDGYVTATTQGVLTNKLLQLCGGAVYDDCRNPIRVHDDKMEAFSELLEQLHGQPALVFYAYQHERDRLLDLLAKKHKDLRVRELKTPEDQKAWNRREVDVLLTHPASTAYGLNLQAGGNHVVWYGLNWSLELYQQANKRLHRQGQDQAVIVHRLLVKGGRDEDVALALEDKGDVQQALLDSLKVRIDRAKSRIAA